MSKLFRTIQFSINMQFKYKNSKLSKPWFSSIWPIDRTLSGVTTPGQSGPGSNGNKGVLCIPQSSSNLGTSPPDCLVSYPGHSCGGGLTFLQRSSLCILQPQPTWQVIPKILGGVFGGGGVLSLCRKGVGVFYSPSWLGKSYPGQSLGRRGLIPLQRCSHCD